METPHTGIERHRFGIGLEDLQTFLAVAELGSFSRAAKHLNLSQPSISNRVRRLEEKLLVRLLDRTTRQAVLTQQGRRLYSRASETLRGLHELLQEFNSEALSREREVQVTATLMVATVMLPPILRRFHDLHPSISLTLHDRRPSEAIEKVAGGDCDMALMVLPQVPSNISFEPLISDPCVVVTPLGHKLLDNRTALFAEVLEHVVLTADGHDQLRQAILAEAGKRNLPVRISPEARGASNVMTLLAMAAAGLGVCIHPRSLIPPELRSIIGVVPLADCEIVRTFGIVTADRHPLSPAARRFREFLRAEIAQAAVRSSGAQEGQARTEPAAKPARGDQSARRSAGDGRSPGAGRDNPRVSRSVLPK